MASLLKRGRYYYGCWQKMTQARQTGGYKKGLKLRYKNPAQKALEELDRLEDKEEIDSFSTGLDPAEILKNARSKTNLTGKHLLAKQRRMERKD